VRRATGCLVVVLSVLLLGTSALRAQKPHSEARSATLGRFSPATGFVANPRSADPRSTNITLQPSDIPRRLLFRVVKTSVFAAPWMLTVMIGNQATVITDSTLAAYLLDAPAEGLNDVFEVPVTAPGTVSMAFSPLAPDLEYVGYVKLRSDGSVLSQQGDLNLEYFDQDFAADERRRRFARAVVRLEYYDGAVALRRCTAFQFVRGYFLTNLHCVDEIGRPKLIFGLISLARPDGDGRVPARVIARGAGRALDFAVLEATPPATYAGDLLPLDTASSPNLAVARPLEIYQDWTYATRPAGKVLSRDADCTFKPGAIAQSVCPLPAFRHGCDVESGSSGSPILPRDGNAVLGLHFLGLGENGHNCGILIRAIVDAIKSDPALYNHPLRGLLSSHSALRTLARRYDAHP